MNNTTPTNQNTNATAVTATTPQPVSTGQLLVELGQYAIREYGHPIVDTLFNDWLLPGMRYRIRVATSHYYEPSDIIDVDAQSSAKQ